MKGELVVASASLAGQRHLANGQVNQDTLYYKLVATYSGPIEWRACRSQPYGANCTPTSTDFLWEKEIPAFGSSPGLGPLGWAY